MLRSYYLIVSCMPPKINGFNYVSIFLSNTNTSCHCHPGTLLLSLRLLQLCAQTLPGNAQPCVTPRSQVLQGNLLNPLAQDQVLWRGMGEGKVGTMVLSMLFYTTEMDGCDPFLHWPRYKWWEFSAPRCWVSHAPLHAGGLLLGFSSFTHFTALLCCSKGPKTPPSFRPRWDLVSAMVPALQEAVREATKSLRPLRHRGESRAAQRCFLPHTHAVNLDITHPTWRHGFLLHVAEVSLAIQTEVADVPVLLLDPPGKGKWILWSHLVQGSQQPWQAGRAGPKETKLDF